MSANLAYKSAETMTPSTFEQNSALFTGNTFFIAELFDKYLTDPNSVDPTWAALFRELGDDKQAIFGDMSTVNGGKKRAAIIGVTEEVEPAKAGKDKASSKPAASTATISASEQQAFALTSIRALMLIRSYRVRGHLNANLDPLGLEKKETHPELDPASYGFSDADMDKNIFLGGVLGLQTATLRQIIGILKETYCSTIGAEFMHIQCPEKKAWLQERIEVAAGKPKLSADEKKMILKELVEVDSFESFLQLKYPSTKRFSVQGGDVAIAALQQVIVTAASLDVDEIILGMPHRGRMNVLTQVMGKPYVELLSIFHGNMDVPEWIVTSGDVKYHLGVSSDKEFAGGKKVHLSLTANPSHLEAVNPVVMGKTRAKQDMKNDDAKSRVMSILFHGDAAFSGQGLVAECLSLSDLKGYRVGGTLHLIVNNQIGFTTNPKNSRSTPYPTDVAKGIQAPILHVNGEDPEAVGFVSKLAAEYRQKFKSDVVVDIICYRKYGHNESDEPMFTQPIMYNSIAKKKAPARIYAEKLTSTGVMTAEEVEKMYDDYKQYFTEQYEAARSFKPNKVDWLGANWSGFERPTGEHPEVVTGVAEKLLKEVGAALSNTPLEMDVNKKIIRQLEAKKQMIESGAGIDWATAEALAFGTLLKQDYRVRLSGQDSCRGTFSQRHSVIIDQTTEKRYKPLNNLGGEQAKFEVIDSNLSEFAVMGYEYGYSLSEPKALVMWEGQFGDFANGAQVIIDQFIASGEIKWLRMSGLILLLPHGYEGQGPEHSSARLERYLQLCAEDNMQVANCSTPANYFHILRRQMLRNFRKPLVLMTPKSLLRHKSCVSSLKDMAEGSKFNLIYGDTAVDAAKVRKAVICSGKVYYDLLDEREKTGNTDVALIRLEQFYPYPAAQLAAELSRYKKAEIVWCQEEPKNMGAWSFIAPYIEETMDKVKAKNSRLTYIGRKASASTATGYAKIHEAEQKAIVTEVFAK